MTRAPCQLAICAAACPTLPLTPMTSTVSPALGMPARRKPSMAVTKGTPMPAASSNEMLAGFSTAALASITGCVAWVPCDGCRDARTAEHLASISPLPVVTMPA
jgi:hypothetical protein